MTTCRLISNVLKKRGFHSTAVRRIDPRNVEEVNIPVPWGNIAGKWWGKKDKQPILALHGWQDNAGSWDPLAQLLPDDLPLLAIDLPGNGLSSHLPPFQNYYFTDAIGTVKRIKKHLGFGNLKLLGHSGGSAICFMYSGVFPEDVDHYFGIDWVAHCYKDEDKRARDIGGIIDRKIENAMRDHMSSRRYTWEDARDTWIRATENSLDEKSADTLMIRGVQKFPDGKVIFSRDHRLKSKDINIYNPEQVAKFAESIRCHVHVVEGLRSPFMAESVKNIPNLLDIIKANAKSFAHTKLDGKHHLHMDIPEQFLPLVVEFFKKE